jgi:hypothetical protein
MKIAIGAIGIIVIALGAWYFLSRPAANAPVAQVPTAAAPADASAQANAGATISPGSSNADLDANLQQVDAGIEGATTDSASASASFNDQMVPQAQ